MRRLRNATAGALLASAGAVAFLVATRPQSSPAPVLPAHVPDLANGAAIYRIGGCFACHQPPAPASATDATLPTGGSPFPTPIGTFYPGNLTPDAETGLGRWTATEFVVALTRGVSPDGRHYFPALPYASYAAMTPADLLDLFAYLRALPARRSAPRAAEIPLQPLARRGVGLWKLVAGKSPGAPVDHARSAAWNRGAYLVAAPGHCGECHTPRNLLMLPDRARSLAGGPHPAGEGKVPSLHGLVARGRYRDAADLALALQFGETLGYDKLASGGMGKIQSELAAAPEPDLAAIAEYLVSLP